MKENIPWDLIISKLRQDLSKEDEVLLDNWLLTGNNKDLFRQLEIVWKSVQEKSAAYDVDLEYYWQELSSKVRQNANREKKTRKLNFRYFYRAAAAVAILFSISYLFNYYIDKRDPEQLITYSTKSNRSSIFLPDGSEVILHANTAVSYHSNKKSGEREVSLTGEAYFKVRHDSRNPFFVNANGVSIKVHGTEFNVCNYSSDKEITVSLIEGSISMNTSSEKEVFLQPGEEALFDKDNQTLSIAKGDMDLAEIWTKDHIRFENKSLPEVCKYLSKWYGIDIKLDPDIVENQSYTFIVTDQPLTEIIEIMASISSFEHYFVSEKELVLKQKK